MIEILKQALEALEVSTDWDLNATGKQGKSVRAIMSLRQAIAELESQEPVATVTSETGADITMSWWHEPPLPIGTKLFTYPPQRTEPPDWFPAVENILNEYGLQAIDFVADFKAAMKDAEQSQRTWVGLTNEQIEHLWETRVGQPCPSYPLEKSDWVQFARAIEAKLKQKNGYAEEKNT
jgi:hypothetical protein